MDASDPNVCLHDGWLRVRRAVELIALMFLVAGAIGLVAAQDFTLVITQPRNKETIHDNTGKVPVSVAIANGGKLPAGDAIHVLLDGRPFGPPQHDLSFVLENVDRGEHRLQVQLMDASGKALASSASVTFFMWRASALFPGRS